MSTPPERTALYRIRGEADELLYIGITNNVPFRWNGHQAVQPWWDELRSLTVKWYETRTEAEAAEKAAIPAEQPKYNVTYLKPIRRAARKPPEVLPIEPGKAEIERRDDDEDLLTVADAAKMARLTKGKFLKALAQTDGPRGFTLGDQTLFRRGEIRQWIADVEAFQRPAA